MENWIVIFEKLPEFCFQSEKLDTIIWNDKKGEVLEIFLFGHHIGYFGYIHTNQWNKGE